MASSQNTKTTAAKKKPASKASASKTGKSAAGRKTAGPRKKTAASGSRRTSNKKRTASSRRTSGRMSEYEKKQMIKQKSGMYDEIKLLTALVLSIIMLISTLGFGGVAGDYIAYFMFGVFGWLAYLVPYFVFFGTAFIMSNRHNRILGKKILAFLLLCLSVMALMQLLISPADTTVKISDYYKNCAVFKNGGGIIGGAICHVLVSLLGRICTFVIIIALLLLSIILIAQRAVFTVLLGKAKVMMAEHRQRREEKQRLMAEIAEEEAEDDYADIDEDVTAAEPAESRRRPQKAQRIVIERPKAENAVSEDTVPIGATPAASGLSAVSDGEDTADFEMSGLPDDFKLADVDIEEPAAGDNITVTRMEPIEFEEVTAVESTEPIRMQETLPEHEAITMTPEGAAAAAGIEIPEADITARAKAQAVTEDAEGTFGAPGEGAHTDMAKDSAQTKTGTAQADNTPVAVTAQEIAAPVKEYVFPPVDLLKRGDRGRQPVSDGHLKSTAVKLQQTLDSFGVKVKVTNVSCGPSVTRYELTPEQGVKVSKIVSLADDIKLNLAVADIRIEAPIPGKSAVGIEVPNKENATVCFRDLIESTEFKKSKSNVSFAVGRDIGGQVIVTDIAKMPHLLIAGATGSGKSVCINTLIMSIIYKAKPEDVRLIMVDPKVVELSVYNGIPHLLIPVVTDPKKAAGALNWAVMEMTDRYQKFAELNVRDIKGYNEKIEKLSAENLESETYKKLPQIVIIVDELADLMMVAPGEVEDAICRLAQLARAAGIHLVIATQRPSVNVITGLIKANIPSRIAFSVSSGVDSRTIIDMNGAEKLMGKGDMLFYPAGMQKPVRVQGAFISDGEVNTVVEYLNEQGQTADYSAEVADKIITSKAAEAAGGAASDRDVYFEEAGRYIIEKDKASIGMLQRVYKIGFNRAARIMDQLCEAGVVGPEEGTKPRKVLMSAEQFEQYIDECL